MFVNEPQEIWGGPWTTKKLNAFEGYVKAYLKIINRNKHWGTIYFDGFAGSGERKSSLNTPLFEGLGILEEEENLYKGAAERVVSMQIPNVFDYYYFIEKDAEAKDKLEKRLACIESSETKKLVIRQGDCNEEIKKLAIALKSGKFASLVFLDPFVFASNNANALKIAEYIINNP